MTEIKTSDELVRTLTGSIIVFRVMADTQTYKSGAWVFEWRWPGRLIDLQTDRERDFEWMVDRYGPAEVVWTP